MQIRDQFKRNGEVITLYAIYGSQMNFETDNKDVPFQTLDNRIFLNLIAKGEIKKLN